MCMLLRCLVQFSSVYLIRMRGKVWLPWRIYLLVTMNRAVKHHSCQSTVSLVWRFDILTSLQVEARTRRQVVRIMGSCCFVDWWNWVGDKSWGLLIRQETVCGHVSWCLKAQGRFLFFFLIPPVSRRPLSSLIDFFFQGCIGRRRGICEEKPWRWWPWVDSSQLHEDNTQQQLHSALLHFHSIINSCRRVVDNTCNFTVDKSRLRCWCAVVFTATESSF